MNTPICDFVKEYADRKASRLHMPGHKGKDFLGIEHLDITEIEGADVLYNAQGIIKESMKNASSLFGSARTLYSTEGSSLSIRAMLYLVAMYAKTEGRKPVVLAGRNAHKAFLSGAALNDIEVKWIYPDEDEGLLSLDITPQKLKSYLGSFDEKPVALYVTSPDYLGNILDIRALSEVCKANGMLLLVDNAHGAYLNFLPDNQHPLALGADMCCDSAHKTLPVITGGGYLHINKQAPKFLSENAENGMSLFASTSPSYLVLQSLDMANKYLAEGYKESLAGISESIENLKSALKILGFALVGNEKLKLTISTKPYGYKGWEIADILYKASIVCEFADDDYIVFMFSPSNTDKDIEGLRKALTNIEKKSPISAAPPVTNRLTRVMNIRDAVFSTREEISVDNSEGRILADYSISCPPAVPIAICGEIIDKSAIDAFRYYGITKIKVIR